MITFVTQLTNEDRAALDALAKLHNRSAASVLCQLVRAAARTGGYKCRGCPNQSQARGQSAAPRR